MSLLEREQQLLADLTCGVRNIQILHWNLLGVTFPSLHPYLGDLYEQLNDYIDIVAEQIKFLGEIPKADLMDCCTRSNVVTIPSKAYKEKLALTKALNTIVVIKESIDGVVEEADEIKNWAATEIFSGLSADVDKVIYFLSHSNGKEDPVVKNKTTIAKYDDDKQLVFGWASISKDRNGKRPIDWQGDIYDIEDIEQPVYDYVVNSREINANHKGSQIGQVVECVVFTKEKMKAMGIREGILPEGVWIGVKVEDRSIFEKIKLGEYKMFSIEGEATRIEVVEE